MGTTILSGMTFLFGLSAWMLLAQAEGMESPSTWFSWVERHGFTTVFAMCMLVGMILALKFAAKFAKNRFEKLEERCDALGKRLDELTTEDRQRMEKVVSDNTMSNQKVADALDRQSMAFAARPCQAGRDAFSGP